MIISIIPYVKFLSFFLNLYFCVRSFNFGIKCILELILFYSIFNRTSINIQRVSLFEKLLKNEINSILRSSIIEISILVN